MSTDFTYGSFTVCADEEKISLRGNKVGITDAGFMCQGVSFVDIELEENGHDYSNYMTDLIPITALKKFIELYEERFGSIAT